MAKKKQSFFSKISLSKITDEQQEKIFEKTNFALSNILRLSILAGTIALGINGQFLMMMACIGILILTFLPAILQRNYLLTIPIEFELSIVIFLYAALFLGEIKSFYNLFWWWDLMLHTLSGIMLGLIGFVLVYVWHSDPKVHVKLKPIFIALFALCFAVTIGVVWEIFEFFMDSIFGLNMLKSGLIDTMWDLIVDFLGALIVSFVGFFFVKYHKLFFMKREIEKFVEKNPHIFKKLAKKKKVKTLK